MTEAEKIIRGLEVRVDNLQKEIKHYEVKLEDAITTERPGEAYILSELRARKSELYSALMMAHALTGYRFY